MFTWLRHNEYLSVKAEATPGIIASIIVTDGQARLTWWVGPKGAYDVPSEAKGMAWAERFMVARGRAHALALAAASTGLRPFDARPADAMIDEATAARYHAFVASYKAPSRRRTRR